MRISVVDRNTGKTTEYENVEQAADAMELETLHAVEAGWLTKPDACSRCGRTDSPIQAHHKHYDKPDSHLYVEWLCIECHRKEHSSS